MSQNQLTISSNTLFHFTNKIKNLVSILTEEFKPHFCLEDLNFIDPDLNHTERLEFAIPMVCFCDIPLSLVKNHMKNYGYYGIGLKKEWGMRNSISPVLYAYKNSAITSGIVQVLERIYPSKVESKQQGGAGLTTEAFDDIFWISCFIKPYEGKLWKGGNYTGKTRFYDEREWRFVPKPNYWFKDWFRLYTMLYKNLDDSQRNEVNCEIGKKAVLHFEPSDIKYIIVSKEKQIATVIKKIERIKRYSQDEIKLLCSRVISAEQICYDF